MKFRFLVIVILISLFMVSCEKQEDSLCYYACFGDSAFIFAYSSPKNTVYKIDVPTEVLIKWAQVRNLESLPSSLLDFSGVRQNGFIIGSPETFVAFQEIMGALDGHYELLADEAVSEKMNRLCGEDMAELGKVFQRGEPALVTFDAANFLSVEDIYHSRNYFCQWLMQVIGIGTEPKKGSGQ
ncbi:MAG: hypothetical protein MJ052_00820 [Sphaerochaetaceae bacterium]|nr:hypothetical protein [Sphaerochaetaceae bacterium]